MATLIKTDGTLIEVTPKNGKDFQCDELQEFVQGHFELVNLEYKFMVVNEDGLHLGLDVNHVASLITILSKSVRDMVIVGDVLLCGKGEIL